MRADPSNGLCMSGTFHLLFDNGLIGVTPDYRIHVSSRLTVRNDSQIDRYISLFEGNAIMSPQRFAPSPEHLTWHMANVFIR